MNTEAGCGTAENPIEDVKVLANTLDAGCKSVYVLVPPSGGYCRDLLRQRRFAKDESFEDEFAQRKGFTDGVNISDPNPEVEKWEKLP